MNQWGSPARLGEMEAMQGEAKSATPRVSPLGWAQGAPAEQSPPKLCCQQGSKLPVGLAARVGRWKLCMAACKHQRHRSHGLWKSHQTLIKPGFCSWKMNPLLSQALHPHLPFSQPLPASPRRGPRLSRLDLAVYKTN